jgi:microcompartment protein CcmK/EutM
MQLARVTGTVVATVKVPGLTGIKLLLVQPLDRHLRPVGGQVVAADAVHMAGPGELVYIVAAREAAAAMPDPFVPVDHAIVGIVDAVRSLAGDDPAAPVAGASGASTAGLPATEAPAAEPPAAEPPARKRRPRRTRS